MQARAAGAEGWEGGCQNDLQSVIRHHLDDGFLRNWTEDQYCLGDEGACAEEPIT